MSYNDGSWKRRYRKDLEDQHWLDRRIKIIERDGQCQHCGESCSYYHVHHKYYAKGEYWHPWEYPDSTLITLCEPCHIKEHDNNNIGAISPNLIRRIEQEYQEHFKKRPNKENKWIKKFLEDQDDEPFNLIKKPAEIKEEPTTETEEDYDTSIDDAKQFLSTMVTVIFLIVLIVTTGRLIWWMIQSPIGIFALLFNVIIIVIYTATSSKY